jgi:hypothetical protein
VLFFLFDVIKLSDRNARCPLLGKLAIVAEGDMSIFFIFRIRFAVLEIRIIVMRFARKTRKVFVLEASLGVRSKEIINGANEIGSCFALALILRSL